MSYWHHGGMAELSHSQIDRVRAEILERAKRYLRITTLNPVDCAAQLALINEKQNRLNELISDRNNENDRFRRIRLSGPISRLRVELYFLKAKALQDNCLRNPS